MSEAYRPVPNGPNWRQYVPVELWDLNQWVLWSYEERDGKRTKIPKRRPNFRGKPRKPDFKLGNAKSTDPDSWCSWVEVNEALETLRAFGAEGPGFVFSVGDPYTGIDVDNCLEADGVTVKPWAAPYVDRLVALKTYAEVSPSGTGIKFWVRGKLGGGGMRVSGLGPDGDGAIEMYDSARFFTVTGASLDPSIRTIAEGSDLVSAFEAELRPLDRRKADSPPPAPQPVHLDDEAIIGKAVASKGRFAKLYAGDTGDYGGDDSRADLALCNLLAWWTGGEPGRMDRIFRTSGLFRAKWDELRGATTYGQRTIDVALAGWGGECYSPPKPKGRPAKKRPPEGAPPPHLDGEAATPAGGLPQVVTGPDVARVIQQVIPIFAEDHRVYQRGNRIVTIRRPPKKLKASLISRPPATPVIGHVSSARALELISERIDIVRPEWDDQKQAWKYVSVMPPPWVVAGVVDRGEWDEVRPIEGIVQSPTIRADGSVLEKPGHDPETCLVYEPNIDFPPVPASITRIEARDAANLLLAVVSDFPFAEIKDGNGNPDGGLANRHAWLAALLTLIVRRAIDGPVPIMVFDANCPGSGKTKLVDVISIIASGLDMARAVYPEREEEREKVIGSIALAGDNSVLFDNLHSGSSIGGKTMDLIATSTRFKPRILGLSQMPEMNWYTVIYATGNNLGITGDGMRRVMPTRLESPLDQPETRDDFRIKTDLLQYVRDHRAELVIAALTIVRGYFLAGRPAQNLTPMDFGPWCRVVRDSIHWATGVDVGIVREQAREADSETAERSALIKGLAEIPEMMGDGLKTSQIREKIAGEPTPYPGLKEVMIQWSSKGELPSPRSIGMRLKTIKDRTIGNLRIRSVDLGNNIQAWKVECVEVERRTPSSNGTNGTNGTKHSLRGQEINIDPTVSYRSNGNNGQTPKAANGPISPISPISPLPASIGSNGFDEGTI